MELYGQNQAVNASQSTQLIEWTPTGSETGLEGFGMASNEPYPERPGFPNCVYYMRTGVCGYGVRCRYNHPQDRAAVFKFLMLRAVWLLMLLGRGNCKSHRAVSRTEWGSSIKFNHPKNRGGSLSNVTLNTHGYPLKPGETECSYYLQTGHCKFGITCKFHHPQRANTLTTTTSAPQFYQTVQSPSIHMSDQYGAAASTNLRVRTSILPGTYMQGTYGPVLFSPGVVPIPGWSPYSAPVSPVLSPGAQTAVGATSLYGVTQLSATTPAPPRPHPSLLSSGSLASGSQKEHTFPERPGEPECQYYIKTGNCKYGSFCRYHHPHDRVVPITDSVLNPLGLPLRLGMQPCSFYLQTGYCKFGSTCKFDHPIGGAVQYSPPSSSLVDMPVAPYLVGSLLATVSPPSPSYELRPELFSVPPRKITYLSRSPPGHTSNSPIGMIFSHAGSLSAY
ncbi:Zinc finger CCCH domain-containing protein 32 [Linum perenne]